MILARRTIHIHIVRSILMVALVTVLLSGRATSQTPTVLDSTIDPFTSYNPPPLPEWMVIWDWASLSDSTRLFDSYGFASTGDGTYPMDSLTGIPEPPRPDPVRVYDRYVADKWVQLSRETNRVLDSMPPRSYLRMLPVSSRKPVLSPPAKLKTIPAIGQLKARVPATFSKYYTSDSTVEQMAAWYTTEFGFQFKFETQYLDTTNPLAGAITVASAAKRLNNSVVSVMIWNPRVVKVGKRKAQTTQVVNKTTIATQERAFRPREMLVAEGVDAMVEFTWKVPYANLIQKAATKYQIDPHLLAAIIQQESNFSKTAMSVDSAIGLMQMIPTTAEHMGVSDPTDPVQAIDGGVRYFKMMLRRYKGNALYALAAYNAGPGNVDKYHGIPPFAETRDYVKRIMLRYREKAGGAQAKIAELILPYTPKKVAVATKSKRRKA